MLELKSICKSFGEKRVLDNFSYKFNDTGLYIVVGDSGIGKTTLLKIISGLDKNFDGEMIGGGIGFTSFCFQEYRLFPWLTALENLLLVSFDKACAQDESDAKELLLKLRLTESDLSLKPSSLSGGMKQRVAFARAIMKDAPLLLLDEPTKEVDADIADIMREIIKEEAKKRTVIAVTHSSEDIDTLDGEIIKIGAR